MQFCFLSSIILSICHGLLLPNNTFFVFLQLDSHYLTLIDELGIQKQLLSQMKTIILQLKKELKTVKQEVKYLKSGNNATQSLAVAALKLESVPKLRVVAELKNESIAHSLAVAELINEFNAKSTRLRNSYDILQKKFDNLQKTNNVL